MADMEAARRQGRPSLLLLPAPPERLTQASLGATYRPALETALVSCGNESGAATLIVAVAAPFLSSFDSSERKSLALSWPDAQALVAGLYTLIAILCAKLEVATDVGAGPESVDARVVLLDYSPGRVVSLDSVPSIKPNNTVIVDLASFAAAYHPWKAVFYMASEAGRNLNMDYLSLAKKVHRIDDSQIVSVPAAATAVTRGRQPNRSPGLSSTGPSTGTSTPQTGISMHLATTGYRVVCLGGTFDHLHPGHKLLLTAGALLLDVPPPLTGPPCEYVIGVTGDELLRNKKYAEYVQPWDKRARNVLDFLASLLALSRDGWEDTGSTASAGTTILETDTSHGEGDLRATFRNGSIAVQCVCIHNPFGPTIEREDIGCLVVSGETRSGGNAVNEKRAGLGWRRLDVFEVDVLKLAEAEAEAGTAAVDNFDAKISSTAIRKQCAEGGSIE